MARKIVPAEIRFREKYTPAGVDECWLWYNRPANYSYAYFWDGRRQVGAHRYALQLKIGRELIRSEFACHSCDNPFCVNPHHLFVGSSADNSQDMVNKFRKETGEDVYGAKMTCHLVFEMRVKYATGLHTLKALATEYGITESNAHHILLGKTWRHVGGPIDTRTRSEKAARGSRNGRSQNYRPAT